MTNHDAQSRAARLAQLAAQMRELTNDDGFIYPSPHGMNLIVESGAAGLE